MWCMVPITSNWPCRNRVETRDAGAITAHLLPQRPILGGQLLMALLQARVALLQAGMLGVQRRNPRPHLGGILCQSLLGAAQLLGHGLQLLHLLRLAAVGLPLSLQGSLDILHEMERNGEFGPAVTDPCRFCCGPPAQPAGLTEPSA